jgi:hypothetical protein
MNDFLQQYRQTGSFTRINRFLLLIAVQAGFLRALKTHATAHAKRAYVVNFSRLHIYLH